MNEKQNSKKSKVWLIVLLVVGLGAFCVPAIGIVAAIAIPAFVRYTKQSKAAEAKYVTRQIAQAAKMSWEESCAFPPAVQPHADISACCGGEKCMPNPGGAAAFSEMGVSVPQPSYFAYAATPSGPDYQIRATADFACGGGAHTVKVVVTGRKDADGTCVADIGRAVTINEFE